MLYWPFPEASPLGATAPQTEGRCGDSVFSRERLHGETNITLKIPSSVFLSLCPNFWIPLSVSVLHPHLPSLYSPLSLETGTQREKCDKAILVLQTTYLSSGRHCWSPCQIIMFPTRAAANLYSSCSVYKVSPKTVAISAQADVLKIVIFSNQQSKDPKIFKLQSS